MGKLYLDMFFLKALSALECIYCYGLEQDNCMFGQRHVQVVCHKHVQDEKRLMLHSEDGIMGLLCLCFLKLVTLMIMMC